MKVLNIIKQKAPQLVLGFILLLAIGITGCKEEVGCTERTADNYNPDAVRDDESCINARDKFLGVYDILHICWPDSFPNREFPQTRFMTIAEDNLREGNDDIKILNFGRDSLTIRALVNKHFITIPRQDLNARGIPMTFTGEGHIDENGYLTIRYSGTRILTGAEVYTDCVIFGQRYDN